MAYRIEAILTGKPVPFRGEEKSAIAKQPAPGPVAVGPMGLAGDEQADRVHHGGTHMAVHHYPLDHYEGWREELDGHPLLAAPGAFGENVSTLGLTESTVLIGDRYRLGSALVEVSQGRQPCWKIDHKFERKGITASVLKSGRCGWYYRVLEPGTVAAGDSFVLETPGHKGWSVERVFALMFHKGADLGELAELAELDALSPEWRTRAAAKVG
ncbi:MOSC domain-containing protein [Erythrobacter sp. SG61-1L]|uniref:MOSC domain-containing protein n=1 Tax=Erythrobacter sp. SG61-1L TaxID=1603897 RepID=UPI000ABA5952|nr:MOSC domain-containing protein [Erythrobacter sp. SG61-1L]